MTRIHATQIKAARAILDWSREDLAAATGLSVATVRNLENKYISYKSGDIVRRAIEGAGIEFIDNEGVRKRADEVRIIKGQDAVDAFYEDVLRTVKRKGGSLYAALTSQEMLLDVFGSSLNDLSRLKHLTKHADIRCLLSSKHELSFSLPKTQFKATPKHSAGPMSYFIYGNKCALAVLDGGELRFVLFSSVNVMHSHLLCFEALWTS